MKSLQILPVPARKSSAFPALLATCASLLLATSASAITLDPGKTYIGDVTVTLADVNTFPGSGFIYENLRNLRAQQLNGIFVDDPLDPGEELTFNFNGGVLFEENLTMFPSFSISSGFSPIPDPLTFDFTYVVEIMTSASTRVTLDPNQLILQTVLDADFTSLFGPTGVTNLSGFSNIVNIREAGVVPPIDPPIDPPPNVIPLPAAGWGLLAGLGALAAMKRRKRA